LHIIVGVNAMDARRLMLPAAALVGAAVLGRLIGIKGLVRAGMAALTVANVSKSAGLLTDETPVRRGAKRNGRATRKRTTRKSAAKKTASAGAH
jgi:hypothetical protein